MNTFVMGLFVVAVVISGFDGCSLCMSVCLPPCLSPSLPLSVVISLVCVCVRVRVCVFVCVFVCVCVCVCLTLHLNEPIDPFSKFFPDINIYRHEACVNKYSAASL